MAEQRLGRFQQLQHLSNRSVAEVIARFSYDDVCRVFPSLMSSALYGHSTETVHEQAMAYFERSAKEQIEMVHRKRNVEANLNELDRISQQAQLRRNRYMQSRSAVKLEEGSEIEIDPADLPVHLDKLSPNEIVACHVDPVHQRLRADLESAIEAAQSRRQELAQELKSKLDQTRELQRQLDARLARLSAQSS